MDAAFNFQHDMETVLCHLNKYYMKVMNLLLFRNEPMHQLTDLYRNKRLQYLTGVLICSHSMFYMFFRYTYYNISICLAYDLVKTVQDPFESGDVRFRRLLPASFTFIGILLLWWVG